LKITSLTTACYRIPLPVPLSDSTHGRLTHFQLVTVQLRDDDGGEGLGYTYTVGHGGVAIRAVVERDLEPLLVGADSGDIDDLWDRMWRRLHYVGRGGMASFAISAVDIALWDLQARRQELPLWKMLGATMNQVPVYAGGIDLQFTEDELLRQTETFLEKGFRAIKMKVGRADLQEDLKRVAAMRKTLGPDFPLMADANMIWTVEQAITAARELRQYDLHWLEEPTAPDDFPGHARIANEGGIPIAAGENLHTHREFEMLIASGGVAFPEPDVANIGGITAWLRVAKLAEQSGLPVTSHGVHDLHVHLLAAVPNPSYLEYHGFGLNDFLVNPLPIANGFAVASDRPGHGVELDWDALQKHRET
jgi:L-alanine-DL-glutamate epimerase-like enolase superfamily enzyme